MTALDLDDHAFAILPTVRVSSAMFIRTLQRNGIAPKIVGKGTGITMIAGLSQRISVMVIGVKGYDVSRVQRHARMCGVQVARIEEASSKEYGDGSEEEGEA